MKQRPVSSTAVLLQQLMPNYASAKEFLDHLEAETGYRCTEQVLCKAKKDKIPAPVQLAAFCEVQFAAGTVTIESTGIAFIDFLGAAFKEKQYTQVEQAATDHIDAYQAGAYRDLCPSILPRLYAYRAVARRGLAREGHALEVVRDYNSALECAKRQAPELVVRYLVSMIAWDSERIFKTYKSGELPEEFFQSKLREHVQSLRNIGPQLDADGNPLRIESIRLQTLLRNSARLTDFKLFEEFLRQARLHARFGKTERSRDIYLRNWMVNDPEHEFDAFCGHQAFRDLLPTNRKPLAMKLKSSAAAVFVALAAGAIFSISSSPSGERLIFSRSGESMVQRDLSTEPFGKAQIFAKSGESMV